MTDSSRLPLARLLLVGVLVPAAFSAVDHWLLGHMQRHPTSGHVALTMAAFVFQVGLLGWLCGTFLDNAWWRWGLYLWGWALVDLQLLAAGVFADAGRWWSRADMLPGSLLAAQVGLAIVWTVLGDAPWQVRVPAGLVLATLLAIPLQSGYGYGYRFGYELYAVQMAALAALCLLLRWRRYQLQRVAAPAGEPGPPAAGKGLGQMQFGIRNVLVWTTSLAVVLGVLRALDLLSLRALAPFLEQHVLALATAGLLVACVFVVAVWAGLGEGPIWLRVPALLFVMVAVGGALAFLEWNAARVRTGTFGIGSLWTTNWALPQLWQEHSWLIVWLSLAGSLLYASLLILRVRGLRLVRTKPQR